MSLSELCVRRPVFATMLVRCLVVLGIFSFRDLGVDLFPKADPATVTVTLQLPGASPDEMASAVVEPMEEALSSISGIDEMTSQRINEGRAQITIKFVLERDINDAASDVREKVAGGLKYVPPQVLPPVIQKVEVPGGTIEQGKSEILLRTLGRIDATDQFNNIVVATVGGTPVKVSDIGYAEDGFERPTQAAWLSGTPAVQLDIRRATGENTIDVIEGVKRKLNTIRRTLPSTIVLTMTRDDSRFIYASIASLEEHLIWG